MQRESGLPTSSNGASSFHLMWDVGGPFREVSVALVVEDLPAVPRLYFWALQAGFSERGRSSGAAHLGLQWHPDHPGSRAVNWGGYDRGGSVLHGSASSLPSARGNPNTRDFWWEPARPYLLRIHPAPEGGWRGEVTDLTSGVATTVRDLDARGGALRDPMVWSEVFAPCEAPSVAVRWSKFAAVTPDGDVVHPRRLRVNYQTFESGGCTNTDVVPTSVGVVQRTNHPRSMGQGSLIDAQDLA